MESHDNPEDAIMPLRTYAMIVGWITVKAILLILFIQIKAAHFVYNGF